MDSNWKKSAEGINTGTYEGKSKVKSWGGNTLLYESCLVLILFMVEEGFGKGI